MGFPILVRCHIYIESGPWSLSPFTLLVLKPEYSGAIRSLVMQLMPWRPASPGYQLLWCWICKIKASLSSSRNDFKCLRHLIFVIEKSSISIFLRGEDLDFNTMWPFDAIWQRSRWTLAHVMACCLKAPSHYPNQCWLLIGEVLWHSPESNFTASTQTTIPYNEF